MDKNLACVLKNAMNKYGTKEAPTRPIRYGEWVECVLPIGADEVAYLTMTQEAYDALIEKGTFVEPRNPPVLKDRPFA